MIEYYLEIRFIDFFTLPFASNLLGMLVKLYPPIWRKMTTMMMIGGGEGE
jgi:hypothetical protein